MNAKSVMLEIWRLSFIAIFGISFRIQSYLRLGAIDEELSGPLPYSVICLLSFMINGHNIK